MSNNQTRYLKGLVVTVLSLASFLGLTLISVFFSYLNQSSLAPKDQQLTFFNYLFPYLLSVGFLIYFAMIQTRDVLRKGNRNWMMIILIVLAAVIAIPWQIKHVIWQIQKENVDLLELLPYVIVTIFTLWTLMIELGRFRNGPTSSRRTRQ